MNIIKANIKWNYKLTPLNPNKINYIVVHHVEAANASPEEIDLWHKDFGWNGAGYNYYVRKDGTVYEMRGDNVGSHCLNYNSQSYGIGCEGNYETEITMQSEQYNSLLELIKWLKERFPNTQIVGHKELYATACPGIFFPLDKIKLLKPLELTVEEAIEVLHEHSIINDMSYWIENAIDGGKIEGSYISTVIKRFIACYKLFNTYNEVLDELLYMGIIGDKPYWSENAVENGICDGEHVATIIKRMARKIKG